MNNNLSKLSHLVLAVLLVILPTLLLVTQGNTAIIRAQTAPSSPPVSPPTTYSINGYVITGNDTSNIKFIQVDLYVKRPWGYYGIWNFVSSYKISPVYSNGVYHPFSFNNLNPSEDYHFRAIGCLEGDFCAVESTVRNCTGIIDSPWCEVKGSGFAQFDLKPYPNSSLTPTSFPTITPTPGVTTYPTPTTKPTATPTYIPLPTPTSIPKMTVADITASYTTTSNLNILSNVYIKRNDTNGPVGNAKVDISIAAPNNTSYILSAMTNQYGKALFNISVPLIYGTYYIDVQNVASVGFIYEPGLKRKALIVSPVPSLTPTLIPTNTPSPTPTATPYGDKTIQGSVTIQNGQQVDELSLRLLKKGTDGVYWWYASQSVRTYGQAQYFTNYYFNGLPSNGSYRVDSYLCKRMANNNLDCGYKGTITYCSGTNATEYCQLTAPGTANFSYVFAGPTPTTVPFPTATPTKFPTATPTPTSLPTPTPVMGTSVTVRASGSVCLRAYPTMVLKIGGIEVKRWTQVPSTIKDYTFTSPYKYTGAVTVHFINDCYRPPEDRNLFVDYITINGKTIQSEAPGVYNTGGYGEWLWSNGFIQYPMTTTVTSPTPTRILPSPTPYTRPEADSIVCERNYRAGTTCEAPINCIRNDGRPTDTYCGVSSFCCLH